MFSWWMRLGRALPGQPARRAPAPWAKIRLGLESLEDRLVPAGLTYEQWQAERFQVDDVAVANVSTQANVAPQAVNQSFGSLIGLDRAFADYSYRGQGESIAVIDTGIDYNHPDLGGGWGRRVIAGYDFVNHDGDPLDDNGHGTHVAGIIGSSSTTYSGVAPNVNLIALKVLDGSGAGSFGDVEAALQWVAAHQAQYNIVAINLSLGSGNYTSNPYAYLDDEFASLNNEGVFISVAAGNSFYTFGSQVGLAFPASDPAVVSVGAVWAKDFGQVSWMSGARDFTTGPDRIASFSQRSAALDLLAPGALITSTYLKGAYQSMAGTSMAAPVVAGAAALLHQALDAKHLPANQAAILQKLQTSGVIVIDGDDENDNVVNSGLSFRRLDVAAALRNVAGTVGDGAPVLNPIADQTMSPGGSRVVTLVAADPNGDPITFSAHVVGAGGGGYYELRQQLGLTYLGDYYTNVWGQNEKWLGSTGGSWYCVLPNGELRRWAGTMNATMTSANLVSTVSAAAYADPSLLWNAQPTQSPPVTLTLAASQLTLQAAANYTGTFQVEVTASDGSHVVTRTFAVTVAKQNFAPVMGPLADLTIRRSRKTSITLGATDAEGDALTYSAVARPANYLACQLDQQLDLNFKGSYFKNFMGLGEKWMATKNPVGYQDWYCILPNGELRRHGGTLAATLNSASLIAKLDPSYFAKPQLLWDAKLQAAPAVNVKVVGNRLTITPSPRFIGSFVVEVIVSDGFNTTRKTFNVRVS